MSTACPFCKNPASNRPPATRRLLKSTALAVAVAGVILITTVLPAEYGIDPTGVGRALGLDALAASGDSSASEAVPQTSNGRPEAIAALSEKAKVAFGENKGQSLDPAAVGFGSGALRQDTMTIEIEPGKGMELKSHMTTGAGMLFRWTSSAPVAVDMHGERPDVKGAWTSYAVEGAQSNAEGTFIAPFDGTHGWYWQNRGTSPVIITIELNGYQADLYQP